MEGCPGKDQCSFHEEVFLRQKLLSWLGFAFTKTGQGQLFFISLDGVCGRHSLASGSPQFQPQPTQFSGRQEEYFPFIHIAFFLATQALFWLQKIILYVKKVH